MKGSVKQTWLLMALALALTLLVGCSSVTGSKSGTTPPKDTQEHQGQNKPGGEAVLPEASDEATEPMDKVLKPDETPAPQASEETVSALPSEPAPVPATTAEEYQKMLADPSLSIEQQVDFYMDKLKDQTYTAVYGDGYTWYTAAEELGKIGKPAIPKLIDRLGTKDDYERALALYALLLATQHENVKSFTNGEYIDVNLDFNVSSHKEAIGKAKAWWEKYKSHF